MQGFTEHTGRLAVLNQDHVDTDRIIPARFLSRVSRLGYGELLFKDVRSAEFALDQPAAKAATILVAGTNFGCGSSREHAVWAIQQAGFQAVIGRREADSPGFSDIFRQNAANCGLLLVEVGPDAFAALVAAGSGGKATIDLPAQTVAVDGKTFPFDIHPATKENVMRGLDLIGTTLEHSDAIAIFEAKDRTYVPVEHV